MLCIGARSGVSGRLRPRRQPGQSGRDRRVQLEVVVQLQIVFLDDQIIVEEEAKDDSSDEDWNNETDAGQ